MTTIELEKALESNFIRYNLDHFIYKEDDKYYGKNYIYYKREFSHFWKNDRVVLIIYPKYSTYRFKVFIPLL